MINSNAGNIGFAQSKSIHIGDLMSIVQAGEKPHDCQFICREKTDGNLLLNSMKK